MGKQNVFENILLFLLLGAEAWYLMFLPFYGQENNWKFTGAYFLLLMAYPLSKKQRINISKRELYLTVYRIIYVKYNEFIQKKKYGLHEDAYSDFGRGNYLIRHVSNYTFMLKIKTKCC